MAQNAGFRKVPTTDEFEENDEQVSAFGITSITAISIIVFWKWTCIIRYAVYILVTLEEESISGGNFSVITL